VKSANYFENDKGRVVAAVAGREEIRLLRLVASRASTSSSRDSQCSSAVL
jgi:hypothetical protein